MLPRPERDLQQNTCRRPTLLLESDSEFWHRGEGVMWTQRTGGVLWNCRLSGKNKRPAVGAHRWAGGKRQLEGSPIYSIVKGWAAGSALTPVYPSQLVWPFDPDPTSTSSFHYRYFSHVYQRYHMVVVQVFAFPLFSSLVTKSYCCCPSLVVVPWRKNCTLQERHFCDLLLNTTSWAFFCVLQQWR